MDGFDGTFLLQIVHFRAFCCPFVVLSIASADRSKAFAHHGSLLKFALSLSTISVGVESVFVS